MTEIRSIGKNAMFQMQKDYLKTSDMNYYTSRIPPTLAEKLKEKGMPILIEQEWYPNGMPKAEKDCHKPMTKFCEVFDWLMARDRSIAIRESIHCDAWYICINGYEEGYAYDTWHEAAEAAIEKALTLI